VGPGCQARARAREAGPLGPREGEGGERARERGEVAWAGKQPSRGGEFFLFLFLFSIFYFSFLFSISISFYLLFF
jgi:hypothetical protein